MIQSLEEQNVEYIFGIPGHTILSVYDAMSKSDKIKHILVRHEQGGVHAAEGYARATGKVGVCLSTSGPGATNLLTGIANAYMDSFPIGAITGQVSTGLLNTKAFQEVDIISLSKPITKFNYQVQRAQEIPYIIQKAFYIAKSGRPGPVLIDIPKDIFSEEVDAYSICKEDYFNCKQYNNKLNNVYTKINSDFIINSIYNSQRTVCYAGGGIRLSNASEELLKFVEALGIPVISSLMGIGSIPGSHPLYLGNIGEFGTYMANKAITEADFILAIGTRFSEQSIGNINNFKENAHIVHIDIEPLHKNINISTYIKSDAKIALNSIIEHIHQYSFISDIKDRNLTWLNGLKASNIFITPDSLDMKPKYIINKLNDICHEDSIICTDVGQHQIWAAKYYKYKHPKHFISSCGFGTMGFGLPAAIGAKLGNPDSEVIVITGDGSLLMNIQELATVAQYNLGIKIIIFNNSAYGLIKQKQDMYFNKNYSHSFLDNPDFCKLSSAFNIKSFITDKKSDVEPILKEAFGIKDLPVIIEFKISKEENVYPVVRNNNYLTDFVDDSKKDY